MYFPMYCDKFADYSSIHHVQWYCNPNFRSTVFCQNLIIYKSSLVTFWSCSDFQNAHMINNNTPRVRLGLWDLSGGVRFRCESTTPFVLCKRFIQGFAPFSNNSRSFLCWFPRCRSAHTFWKSLVSINALRELWKWQVLSRTPSFNRWYNVLHDMYYTWISL